MQFLCNRIELFLWHANVSAVHQVRNLTSRLFVVAKCYHKFSDWKRRKRFNSTLNLEQRKVNCSTQSEKAFSKQRFQTTHVGLRGELLYSLSCEIRTNPRATKNCVLSKQPSLLSQLHLACRRLWSRPCLKRFRFALCCVAYKGFESHVARLV